MRMSVGVMMTKMGRESLSYYHSGLITLGLEMTRKLAKGIPAGLMTRRGSGGGVLN